MPKEGDILFPRTSNPLKRVTSSAIADVLNDNTSNVNKKLLKIKNNFKLLYEEAVTRCFYHKNGKKDYDSRSFGNKCYKNKSNAKAKDYVGLDHYYRVDYPKEFQKNGYIDNQELCNVIEMKFQRGVKRPLAKKVMSNDNETVKKCSQAALKKLLLIVGVSNDSIDSNDKAEYKNKKYTEKCIFEAIEIFSRLNGVGPASAVFLLSPLSFTSEYNNAFDIPIMSDECLEVLGYARKYTIAEYKLFRNNLIDLADQLNKNFNENSTTTSSSSSSTVWTACSLEYCLWAYGQLYTDCEALPPSSLSKGSGSSKHERGDDDEDTSGKKRSK